MMPIVLEFVGISKPNSAEENQTIMSFLADANIEPLPKNPVSNDWINLGERMDRYLFERRGLFVVCDVIFLLTTLWNLWMSYEDLFHLFCWAGVFIIIIGLCTMFIPAFWIFFCRIFSRKPWEFSGFSLEASCGFTVSQLLQYSHEHIMLT